jgi:hypothetical protein
MQEAPWRRSCEGIRVTNQDTNTQQMECQWSDTQQMECQWSDGNAQGMGKKDLKAFGNYSP